MDVSELSDRHIIDSHIHFGEVTQIPEVLELMERAGVSEFGLVSTIHARRVNLNPPAFQFKARYPDRVYVFGGLDYSGVPGLPWADAVRPTDAPLLLSFAEQVDRLMALGCDGIKTRSGKPTIYRELGLPMDSPVYDGLYARAEARGVPIVWHVGDPQEFWDPDRIPSWARERGWFYDAAYPAIETLYSQVDHVLARYPALTVIFAHFLFLSAQLDRAAALLDQYPNVYLDVTPGVEMYLNFTARWDAAREFFLAHQDRIIFGSDSGASAALYDRPHLNVERDLASILMVRRFLETDETFPVPLEGYPTAGDWPPLRGLALPEAVLAKVYAENFQRVVGARPRPLDAALMQEELDRLEALQRAREGMQGAR
jgi:predicted TIM-barrel fold metal-dependent hydrolase